MDDISHLQYTSGSTRPPVGVEITHRAVGTNLIQMILSIDLLNRNTHGVSWLPLYHDMGLSMIGFPAVYGGHSTLMSPTAFIRRPQRWINALSDESKQGNVVTAAPNFAYEWTAQRGRPAPGDDVDLGNVVMIIGSEPVSIDAITTFNEAFAPYGLPATAIKPSYGIAEATLFVSTTAPTARPTVAYFDRDRLAAGRAVRVASDAPDAVAQVSSGQVARSLSAIVVHPDTRDELSDGHVGEMWLHGNNIGRGYWGLPDETRTTFGATLRSTLDAGSHAGGVSRGSHWLRTGDLGFYLDGELYVTGRIADRITIDGLHFYPQDIESTAADSSPMVRRGYVAAFSIPADRVRDADAIAGGERLVIIAERAAGTNRPTAAAVDAIKTSSPAPPRPDRLRRESRSSWGDPAHDEWQTGPARLSRPVSRRRLGRLTESDERTDRVAGELHDVDARFSVRVTHRSEEIAACVGEVSVGPALVGGRRHQDDSRGVRLLRQRHRKLGVLHGAIGPVLDDDPVVGNAEQQQHLSHLTGFGVAALRVPSGHDHRRLREGLRHRQSRQTRRLRIVRMVPSGLSP